MSASGKLKQITKFQVELWNKLVSFAKERYGLKKRAKNFTDSLLASVDDDCLFITPTALVLNKTRQGTMQVVVKDRHGVLAPAVKVNFIIKDVNLFRDARLILSLHKLKHISENLKSSLNINQDIEGRTDKNGSVMLTLYLTDDVYFGTETRQTIINVNAMVPNVDAPKPEFIMVSETYRVTIIPNGPYS